MAILLPASSWFIGWHCE